MDRLLPARVVHDLLQGKPKVIDQSNAPQDPLNVCAGFPGNFASKQTGLNGSHAF